MVVEFQVREAIDSLVALLRVAEDSAVHCWEQDEAFHPGIFPGLILLARFASQRAGEEFRQAIAATEQIRKLNESCDQLQQQLAQVTAARDAARQQQLAQVTAARDAARQQHLVECRKYNAEVERRLALEKQVAELSGNPGELPAEPAAEEYKWQVGDEIERDGQIVRIQDVQDGRFYLSNGDSWPAEILMIAIGYTLHRKASDTLGVQQLTPRQVEISDSGTDGEGQS